MSGILTVPDSRLRTPCEGKCPGLSGELARQVFMLMKQAGGIGLAGPQIGIPQRFFVTGNGFVFCNPTIVPHGNKVEVVESCLSLPGQSFKVLRYDKVFIESDFVTIQFEGFWAFVVQHEYDHLDGILIDVKGKTFSQN